MRFMLAASILGIKYYIKIKIEMGIFTMLADPKVLIILFALSAVAVFIYYYLRKTTDGITSLERKQSTLQRQLAHGVVVEDEKDKHKLHFTENASDDGTLDCSYTEDEPHHEAPRPEVQRQASHPSSHREQEQEIFSHSKFQQLQREHRAEAHDETDHSMIEQSTGSEATDDTDTSDNQVWRQQAIDDLHSLKKGKDFKLIGNIPSKADISYSGNNEEDIVFNELDDEDDDYAAPVLARAHPHRFEPTPDITGKILEDIKTIDKENMEAPTKPTQAVVPTQVVATPVPAKPTTVAATPVPAKPTTVVATPAPAKPTQVVATPAPAKPTQVVATPAPVKPTQIATSLKTLIKPSVSTSIMPPVPAPISISVKPKISAKTRPIIAVK